MMAYAVRVRVWSVPETRRRADCESCDGGWKDQAEADV